ncbi:hypothetical protein [Ottowia thiooxydans]|uniref:Uncharacterized protein n=1 Tax=Ottowia thiooxydans TaxID=219182 RepID=A0ABV2QCA5_9BURK
MIGLIVIGLLITWLVITGMITAGIVREIRIPGASLLGVLIFPVVAALPFSDEIIGRWQFQRLCKAEAKVWVAPDARNVVAARRGDSYTSELVGYVIPVREQGVAYIDADTGKPFYSYKTFHTPGGVVMQLGLNMGSSSSCRPDKWTSRENGFDIDELMRRGKN